MEKYLINKKLFGSRRSQNTKKLNSNIEKILKTSDIKNKNEKQNPEYIKNVTIL